MAFADDLGEARGPPIKTNDKPAKTISATSCNSWIQRFVLFHRRELVADLRRLLEVFGGDRMVEPLFEFADFAGRLAVLQALQEFAEHVDLVGTFA